MPASARMILHVDPAEKARWTREAKKAGISTAEFVRQAAAQHDPELLITPEEAEQLKAAAVEMNAMFDRMQVNLDAISATIREMVHDMTDPVVDAERRARIQVEIEASGQILDLSRLSELAA